MNHRRPVLHGLMLGLIALGVCSSVFISRTFGSISSAPIASLSLPSVGGSQPDDQVITASVLPNTLEREAFTSALAAYAGEGPAKDAQQEEKPADEPPPLFKKYRVQAGDTASSIATRFGIKLEYILWNNHELRDGDFLSVGTQLYIPVDDGMLHWVSYGETLSGIAGLYGIEMGSILGWPGNRLAAPDQIVEGELVFVPDGVPPAPVLTEPTPAPTPTDAPVLVEAPQEPEPAPVPPPPTSAPPPPPPAPPPAVSTAGMIWPYSCQLSRGFGSGHAGIDIDGVCNPGATIVAAHSGTVVFTGGDACCGYGLYVDIQSPSGIVTRYAHLSRIYVSMGQQVSQGRGIGLIGSTGNSTGTHLHFEVRIGGAPVNPLNYLP